MTVYRSRATISISDLTIVDDGTNYLFQLSGTTLFAISKTEKNMLVIGAILDNRSL